MNVKIISNGKICQIDSKEDLKPNQEVLIEAEGIIEPAIFLCHKSCPKNDEEQLPVNFIRVMTEEDQKNKKKLKTQAQGFLDNAKAKVFRHGLEMKILDAELSFDQKKLTFYFSASERIDFRSLVSDMVGDFGKIIRLQQVGSREEAKLFGGFGKCGRPLCCATFLNNLENITIEMVESQSITNPKSAKMAGCCGKLMCCLSYEADNYKEIKKVQAEAQKAPIEEVAK